MFKVVLNFRNPAGFRWSETYHTNTSGTAESVANLVLGLAFIGPRLKLLAAPNRIYSVAVSDTAYNRSAIRKKINRVGTASDLATGGIKLPDLAGSFVLVQWTGDLPGTRKSTMRGIPDGYLGADSVTGEQVVEEDFSTRFGEWLLELRSNNFGWIPRLPVTKAVPPNVTMYNNILQVDGATSPGYAIITCASNILLPPNGSLTISQTDGKRLPGINGRWFPVGSSNNQFTIDYQVPFNEAAFATGGRIRVYQDAPFNRFAGFEVITSGSRRTGNAFTPLRRGRSARGLRHSV